MERPGLNAEGRRRRAAREAERRDTDSPRPRFVRPGASGPAAGPTRTSRHRWRRSESIGVRLGCSREYPSRPKPIDMGMKLLTPGRCRPDPGAWRRDCLFCGRWPAGLRLEVGGRWPVWIRGARGGGRCLRRPGDDHRARFAARCDRSCRCVGRGGKRSHRFERHGRVVAAAGVASQMDRCSSTRRCRGTAASRQSALSGRTSGSASRTAWQSLR